MAETKVKTAAMPKRCKATCGPDDEDPTIYMCNRRKPHTTLHAETAPDGEVIAVWCSCKDCKAPNTDLYDGGCDGSCTCDEDEDH